MIRKLKIRFIFLSVSALAVLLSLVAGGMNYLNYRALEAEADETLEILSRHDGVFPDRFEEEVPAWMTPEIPYETRYFSVLLSPAGEVLGSQTGNIATIDPAAAASMAGEAFRSGESSGFIGDFRYRADDAGGPVRIVFLDCGRKLRIFENFRDFSLETSCAGLLVMLAVIVAFSARFVRPVAESYERQKQFVADAGHELKTPLTVIGANADLLSLDFPEENESVRDIKDQVRRMTDLTNDMVELARLDEVATPPVTAETETVSVLERALAPFRLIAGKRKISVCAPEELTVRTSGQALSRVVGILLENALKYSPEGAEIKVSLTPRRRGLRLTVSNPSVLALEDDLEPVFGRFYRMDASRNSEIGGTGLGLAMARSIVTSLGGRIRAEAGEGNQFIAKVDL